MNRSKALGMALVALLAAGCHEVSSCTAIGCVAALDLSIQSDDWVPGDYVVEITPEALDVKPLRCTLSLPRTSGEAADCSGPGSMYASDGLSVSYWDPNPTPAQLTVTRDGQMLLDTRIDPTYKESFPNGPDCGTCYGAQATVSVP